MKILKIITYTSTVAVLTGMPFLTQRVHAGPMPVLGQISIQLGRPQQPAPPPPPQYQSNWNDDQKRELRHIYYRLEHANADYEGHRANALREIRHAAEAMGMDLHGSGYAQQWQGSPNYGGYSQQTESQEWSDNALRHSRDRLRELANGIQDDQIRHRLFDAVHELDRALEVR